MDLPYQTAGSIRRRDFLGGAAALAGVALIARPANAVMLDLEALAFDGFALFDPAPVFRLAETIFPGRGSALSVEWRNRLFQYTWLRAAAGRYADFTTCIEEALRFAASVARVDLSSQPREMLVNAYLDVVAFPDVRPALLRLKEAGLRLVILANPTPAMLARAVERSNLGGLFEDVISTDRVKSYKPDPRTYRLAVDSLRLNASTIGFIASADWDATGAHWFGFPSFWVDRTGLPAEQLGAARVWTGRDMRQLADALLS